jgi:hypothetical protein
VLKCLSWCIVSVVNISVVSVRISCLCYRLQTSVYALLKQQRGYNESALLRTHTHTTQSVLLRSHARASSCWYSVRMCHCCSYSKTQFQRSTNRVAAHEVLLCSMLSTTTYINCLVPTLTPAAARCCRCILIIVVSVVSVTMRCSMLAVISAVYRVRCEPSS